MQLRSGAGSAASSAADLARHERQWEVGSQYRDGWSDGEDLAGLVSTSPPEAAPLPHAASEANPSQACAAVQTSDTEGAETTNDDESEGGGSPGSFVEVQGEEGRFGRGGDGDGDDDFESVPLMRTCATQTAQKHVIADVSAQSHVGGSRGGAGGGGRVVGVDDGLAGIAAAFGDPGRGAASPRQAPGLPPTRLYGFPGVVFEVLEGGGIASLTLFSADA